jgi:hypothetical protein
MNIKICATAILLIASFIEPASAWVRRPIARGPTVVAPGVRRPVVVAPRAPVVVAPAAPVVVVPR